MKLLIIFLFITHSLFAFSLKEKFQDAEAGTYVVTSQNQTTTLLHLHTKNGNQLLFEEISIPSHQTQGIEWKKWPLRGAPGHTSWILYELDLDQNRITESYSLSRKSWVPTDEMEAFLIPLINLNLDFLSEELRMQKGPTQTPGKIDRKPWGPPQVIHGEQVKDPEYDVYTTCWPYDNTDLAGKPLVLYFNKGKTNFPFPYWIQGREGAIKFKIRAVDSGTNMISLTTTIPRRPPVFIDSVKRQNGCVSLTLNIPTYYKHFSLYAIDITENPRLTHVIPYEIERHKEVASLSIDERKLSTIFTHGHEYLWILSSDAPEAFCESPHLFKWISKS